VGFVVSFIPTPAEFRAYDPAVPEIARFLCCDIETAEPALRVEHIGSTSVPGCGGKGKEKAAFVTGVLKQRQPAA